MATLVSWKIGGEQGQGIDSTGEILTRACNRLGYYLYAYKLFSSRIKGGHSNYKIRIGTKPVASTSKDLQILVAIDQETIDKNWQELGSDSLVVADPRWEPVLPEGCPARLVNVPMKDIAQEIGNPLARNVVALGASVYLLGLPLEAVRDLVLEIFARKGEKVQNLNVEALQRGWDEAQTVLPDGSPWVMEPGDGTTRMLLTGNEAIAMGALAGGCRIVAAYPITPASEVMEWLAPRLPRFGGVVIQAEDEISAAIACIGAGYAGARALTSTSGPGFSLMQEAIGLGHVAEVPMVIVDCQRAGPSTGMPTKHEQSDMFAMLYGSHGDTPRVVLAPSTADEAFYDAAQAFNLADRLQCPVILASDLSLSLNKQTVENLDYDRIKIDRGELVSDETLAELGQENFRRYAVTDSGVSPRSLPGQPLGQYQATGVEHDPRGEVSENPQNRVAMMDKRFRKVQGLDVEGVKYSGPEEPDIVLVGIGSSLGPLAEAQNALENEQIKVGHAHIRLLAPFPTEELAKIVGTAKKILVVESNAAGQLAAILKLNMGLNGPEVNGSRAARSGQRNGQAHEGRVVSLVKYDGTTFVPEEIVEKVQEVLLHV